MAHRANWHVPAKAPDGLDPFAEVETAQPVLPLEPTLEDLQAYLRTLLEREADLDAKGIRCEIKDRPHSVCAACPLRERIPGREPLCRLGLEQERTLMKIATFHERDRVASA